MGSDLKGRKRADKRWREVRDSGGERSHIMCKIVKYDFHSLKQERRSNTIQETKASNERVERSENGGERNRRVRKKSI